MPLDPSIALNVKPIEIANPVDMATKALTLKSLGQQSQMQDQQFQDQQSLRDAFKQNINSDGSVNRQGVLNALGQSGQGQKVIDLSHAWQGQDLEKFKQQSEVGKTLAASVYDEPSYQNALSQMAKLYPDKAAQMPPHYDPNYVQNWKQYSLDGHEQFDQAYKTQQLGLDTQKVGIEGKKADAMIDRNNVQRETNSNNKQNQNMQQTLQLLESARGNPAASQAEKDIYASQKLNSLIGMGDPNKLNPQMVQLAASEVAKIAAGGAPTSHELQGLVPSTIPSGLASLAQSVTNNPTGANAGEFLKQYKAYADSLTTDAQKVISDKYGRVIESKKGSLAPDQYQTLQDQYINRFKSPAPASAASKPAWAK